MLGVARRPRGAAQTRSACLAVVLTGLLAGCGGVGQPASYDATGVDGLEIPTPAPDPADFVEKVDNPWLALDTVGRWRYRLEQDGTRAGTLEVETLGGRHDIAGLRATAVRSVTLARAGGAEVSVVTRYYAQDESGNVWLVGESAPGRSWRAGEDGALAGLAMPAEPRTGDGWVRADVPGSPAQAVRVVDPPAVLPVDGLRAEELSGRTVWTSEGTPESSVHAYVAGVGLVHSEALDAGQTVELVEPAPG